MSKAPPKKERRRRSARRRPHRRQVALQEFNKLAEAKAAVPDRQALADHHMKEEREQRFEKARKSKMDLAALKEQLAARKEELMAQMETAA